MKKIFITGAAGFIGSHIVSELLKDQKIDLILGYDNLIAGRLENISPSLRDSRFQFLEGDIRDATKLEAAMKGCDGVIHQAALTSVPGSVADPASYYDVNVTGTIRVLEACRKLGIQQFVMASSSAVYGDHEQPIKTENLEPRPKSPYALSKSIDEQLCHSYSNLYGIHCIALRYFNVYGPKQDPHSPYAAVIPKFMDCIKGGRPFKIFGTGAQTRDFVFVEDVARANIASLKACSKLPLGVFNVGTGKSLSVSELAKKMESLIGKPWPKDLLPPLPGDILHSCSDPSQITQKTGWKPELNLDAGLQKTRVFFSI